MDRAGPQFKGSDKKGTEARIGNLDCRLNLGCCNVNVNF